MAEHPKEIRGKSLRAVGYRLIARPIQVEETIETGAVKLYKPQQTVEAEKGGVDRGQVLSVGPDAFKEASNPWCQPGDWIVWPRYAGKPMEDEILGPVHVLNDLDVLAKYEERTDG